MEIQIEFIMVYTVVVTVIFWQKLKVQGYHLVLVQYIQNSKDFFEPSRKIKNH